MAQSVKEGVVVSLAYELRLPNGDMIDQSTPEEPLDYLHGADNIVPGLERELEGMAVGDTKTVVVAPEDGYGQYDPEQREVVNKADLPKDFPLQLGMTIAVTDDEGYMEEAMVREINANSVTLDFNHPLAGQELHFSVQVVGIRDATEEELEHGHPHGVFEDEDYLEDEDFDDEFEYDFSDELDDDEDELEDDDDDDAPKGRR